MVAVGLKNYLFAGSHAAAERAAIFYSLFSTSKVHSVNPYYWLKDVLDKLASWKLINIDNLLPQNWAQLMTDSNPWGSSGAYGTKQFENHKQRE
jgi:transposase